MKQCTKNNRPGFLTAYGICIYDTAANRRRHGIPLKSTYVETFIKRKSPFKTPKNVYKKPTTIRTRRIKHSGSKTLTPNATRSASYIQPRKRMRITTKTPSPRPRIVATKLSPKRSSPKRMNKPIPKLNSPKRKMNRPIPKRNSPKQMTTKPILKAKHVSPKSILRGIKMTPISALGRCSKMSDPTFSKRVKNESSLARKVLSGKIPFNGCNFIDYIDQSRTKIKDSDASMAQLWFTYFKYNGIEKPVVAKVTLGTVLPDNELSTEREIYIRVTNPLLLGGCTPNVVLAIGEASCNTGVSYFGKPSVVNQKFINNELMTQTHENILHKCEAGYCDPMYLNILLLEKIHNVAPGIKAPIMKKYVNSSTLKSDVEFFRSILFQTLYTLLCFQEVGLQHNDLHFGNIMIDYYKTPIKLCYQIGPNKYFYLETKYLVKLFDFDRGNKVSSKYNECVINNLGIQDKFCEEYGQCNSKNPKIDYVKFLLHMVYSKIPHDIDLFLGRAMSRDFFSKILPKYYNEYYLPCASCMNRKAYIPPNMDVQPLNDLLNDVLFNDYKIAYSSIPKEQFIWKLPSLHKYTK